MAVDLQQVLQRVRARFEIQLDVHISWATEQQLRAATGFVSWAACDCPTSNCPGRTIVISTHAKRAPGYVLDYLVTHEYLHFLIPSKHHIHTRHFRIAEQAHGDYVRANRWLHKEALRRGYEPVLTSTRSAFWRIIH
jgi:hypothetical protein